MQKYFCNVFKHPLSNDMCANTIKSICLSISRTPYIYMCEHLSVRGDEWETSAGSGPPPEDCPAQLKSKRFSTAHHHEEHEPVWTTATMGVVNVSDHNRYSAYTGVRDNRNVARTDSKDSPA